MTTTHTTNLISWLYQLTNASSPTYYIFNFLIQTTIYISVTAIFILLFKLIFKNKLPAKWHVIIWALLLIRFVVPALPSSPVSVFNAAKVSEESIQQASYHIIVDNAPDENVDSDVSHIDVANADSAEENNNNISEILQNNVGVSSSSGSSGTILPIDTYVSFIWIIGSGIMLVYFLIIYIIYTGKLKKSRRPSDELTLNILTSCKETLKIKRNVSIYYADTSPMLAGIFKPTLYLPDTYTESETRDVILHELCHMKNFDILFTLLATVMLCLNWFNPIIWISFFVFKRDLEVFCDERTLRYSADKQNYARLLLKTATTHREKFVLGTTSLQSGNADVKRRIKYMAFFKKPAVFTVIAALLAASVISVCCLTNSVNSKSSLTFINPVTDSTFELFLDNTVIEPTNGESNFFFFETGASMDTIYKSISKNNSDIRIEEISEKEFLLHCDDTYCPYILISKNVKDTKGNELDNVLVLECIGTKTYAIPLHDESNMPHMKYSYYFPTYLIDNRYIYNTDDKTLEFEGNTNPYPFYGNVKLIDSKYTNFSDILDFYKGLPYYSIDTWGNDFTGGEILIQDEYSDKPLYSIYYNEEKKTVKYQAYPAFAAECAKSVIYKYFNAIKNHNVESYAECLGDGVNYNDMNSELDNIRDVVLVYINIKDFDNEKMQYTYDVVYDIAYGAEGSATHIESRFVVNFSELTPIITDMNIMTVDDNIVSTSSPIDYCEEVELSDIDNMNIGSEMPSIDYADENKVIISGTCGVVVYDLNNREVSKRVSYEELKNLGVVFPYAFASTDGKTVYIRDAMEDFHGTDSVNNTYKNYTLDTDSGALYEWEGLNSIDASDIYETNSILDSYEKYFDKDKLIGSSVAERENDFIFLQCTTDWQIKNLQIVICNKSTGEKEEIYVFQ